MKLKLQHFDHLMQRADSSEKTLMLGKTEGEKGVTEDEMVRWYLWLNGHEFDQAPGDDKGQGGLVCCSPWGGKEPDTTEWLKNKILTNELWIWKEKKFPDLDLTKLWYFKIFYLKMYFQTLEYEQRGKIYIFDSWYLRKGASENCCIHIYDAK